MQIGCLNHQDLWTGQIHKKHLSQGTSGSALTGSFQISPVKISTYQKQTQQSVRRGKMSPLRPKVCSRWGCYFVQTILKTKQENKTMNKTKNTQKSSVWHVLCVCVCVCVCTCVRMCACMRVCVHACVHVLVNMCASACKRVHVCACEWVLDGEGSRGVAGRALAVVYRQLCIRPIRLTD